MNKRILLLEPYALRRQNIALALTTTGGFEVISFSAWPQANHWLSQHHADICLLSDSLYSAQQLLIPTIILGQGNTATNDMLLGNIASSTPIHAIPQYVFELINQSSG
ncbi:hypothetical protein QX776_07245 [Alteromonadaceae bacterium BrNp21-10]|nr:hypothetical protein [Alteromonadaceae bacterium BrNp21-10]